MMLNKIENIDVKDFLGSLNAAQKSGLSSFVPSISPGNLRKTVYLSSGGKYLKYTNFMRLFAYQSGFVPIHPVVTLDYYLSTVSHNNQKQEIIRDCFSLLLQSSELWVFEETLPEFGKGSSLSGNRRNISSLPEGVLAEIYFWLLNKTASPIRFFTWSQIGIPKYDSRSQWSLVPGDEEKPKGFGDVHNGQGRFGIIDLGSSTVKLTVCSVDENKIVSPLSKKSITVNLAGGFFENGILQPLPIERTIQAVADCKEEALDYGVFDIQLVGTGILRKAKNVGDFKAKLLTKTGLDLKILTHKDESRLIYQAVANSFSREIDNLIVVNAGGGSTEIVFGRGKNIKGICGLPLGVTYLNETFLSSYPLPEKNYQAMKEHILGILKLGVKPVTKKGTLVYTGGELDYMLITGFPLEDSDLSLTHPKEISLEAFREYAKKMRILTLEEIHSYMPANPRWMEGAVASNTILETITEYLDVVRIIPSNKNLNDGVLLTMIT